MRGRLALKAVLIAGVAALLGSGLGILYRWHSLSGWFTSGEASSCGSDAADPRHGRGSVLR